MLIPKVFYIAGPKSEDNTSPIVVLHMKAHSFDFLNMTFRQYT